MAIPLAGYINLQEIDDVVDEVERTMPDVAWVRYKIGNDFYGDPAIFFRIVLTDEACKADALSPSSHRVEEAIEGSLQPYQRWGLYPFFNFRSRSEQTGDEDPAWQPHAVSR